MKSVSRRSQAARNSRIIASFRAAAVPSLMVGRYRAAPLAQLDDRRAELGTGGRRDVVPGNGHARASARRLVISSGRVVAGNQNDGRTGVVAVDLDAEPSVTRYVLRHARSVRISLSW